MDNQKEPIKEETAQETPEEQKAPEVQETPEAEDAEEGQEAEEAERPRFDEEAFKAEIHELTENLRESVSEAEEKIYDFFTSANFRNLTDCITDFAGWYLDVLGKIDVSNMSFIDLANFDKFIDDLQTLLPYIEEETDAFKEEVGRAAVTAEEFFRNTDPETGEEIESLYDKVLADAQERADENEKAAKAAENIISIGAHRIEELDYPIDKINSSIFSLLQEDTQGQLTLNVKAEPNRRKKQVDIIYSINFDVVESESGSQVLKRLTQYDKRVYVAVCAVYSTSGSIMTLSMIYQAMGNKGEPGKLDREKINRSLTKMSARITLNNRQEVAAGYKYPLYIYDGDLLPFERLTPAEGTKIYIDGKQAEEYIHVFRMPPLLEFAEGRKQVTTISVRLLQTPLNQTEENLAIEDYCIKRIRQYRREGRKILLSTLYDRCNITKPKQIARTPQKLERLFNYYKECGEIKGYTMTADAIIFDVPKKEKQPVKDK